MARAHMIRGGAGPWLVFLLGLLILTVAAAAWLFYSASRPAADIDVNVSAPLMPAPKVPDPPKLPARTEP